MPKHRSRLHVLLGALFEASVAHPLLIPVIGVPSHLLWWLHVLLVALAAFWYGRRAAAATVGVDGPKVEQILVNLVSNAVDAAPRGRGVVDVELRAEEGDALITVTDNGPGVDPALVDRI